MTVSRDSTAYIEECKCKCICKRGVVGKWSKCEIHGFGERIDIEKLLRRPGEVCT
jgi:hypothetical protein